MESYAKVGDLIKSNDVIANITPFFFMDLERTKWWVAPRTKMLNQPCRSNPPITHSPLGSLETCHGIRRGDPLLSQHETS